MAKTHPKTIFFLFFPLLSALASACLTVPPPTDNNTSPFQLGPDVRSDPATAGYFSNHISLNVRNLTASLEFYSNVLGLREIFTYRATEHMSVAYMGHSQGGRNGSAFQTSDEMNRLKNNALGLLEMLHLDIPDQDHLIPSAERSGTVGHIGFIVPDVEAAEAHIKTIPGIQILKAVGEPTPSRGPIARANGLPPRAWAQVSEEERAQIEMVLSAVNTKFIYVADPDGNILEIQGRDDELPLV